MVVGDDIIEDSGLRLRFSQGSAGWGSGRCSSFGGGWCCTGARRAARSLSLEVFSPQQDKAVANLTQREPGLENHTGPASQFCLILVPRQERWIGLENLPGKSNGHDQKSRKCHLRRKTCDLLMMAMHCPLSVIPGAEYGYDTGSGGRR